MAPLQAAEEDSIHPLVVVAVVVVAHTSFEVAEVGEECFQTEVEPLFELAG